MKKMMKFSTAIAVSLAIASTAYAATPGGYVGIGLGASKLNTPTMNNAAQDAVDAGATYARSTSSRGGLGGHLFGGYNFNQYFGIEAGYATYANSKNTLTATDGFETYNGTAKYSLNAFNVVGKVYLPISESFNLYALGGAARVNSTTKITESGTEGDIATSNSYKKTVHKIRPMYGIGASYNFTQHISTGLEFSQIAGSGNMKTNTKATPTASMLTLNLAYNFG